MTSIARSWGAAKAAIAALLGLAKSSIARQALGPALGRGKPEALALGTAKALGLGPKNLGLARATLAKP